MSRSPVSAFGICRQALSARRTILPAPSPGFPGLLAPRLPSRFAGCIRNSSTDTTSSGDDDPVQNLRNILQSSFLLQTRSSAEVAKAWDAFQRVPNKRLLNRTDFQSILNTQLWEHQELGSKSQASVRIESILSDMAQNGFPPGYIENSVRLRVQAPSFDYERAASEIRTMHAAGNLADQHSVIIVLALADRDGHVGRARKVIYFHQHLLGLLTPSTSLTIPLLLHVLNNPQKFEFSDSDQPDEPVSLDERPQEPVPSLPGYLDNALKAWQRDILAYSLPLSLPAYSLLIHHLLRHDQLHTANTALNDALAHGFDLGWTLMAPFIEHFVALGELEKAMRVFTGIRGKEGPSEPVPGRVYETLIGGQLQAGNMKLAKELFGEAKKNGLSEGAIRRFKAGAGL